MELKFSFFEKQRQTLRYLRDDTTNEVLYGGGARGGKAQPLDAIVYTPFGGKPMGDIKVGDVVSHPSGCNTTVVAIHPQGEKEIFEVSFSDGSKTRCCGDHLWTVWFASKKSKQEKKSGNKGRVQTTKMLIEHLEKGKSILIPLTEPVQFTIPSRRKSLIDPYVLGILIGDGSLTKDVSFTTIDDFIHEEVSRLLPEGYSLTNNNIHFRIKFGGRNKKGFVINPFLDEIRKLGLNCKSEFKFIPEYLKKSSIETRFSLIQGLMDSDGTIDSRGHCSFSSSSFQLAKDVQYLCWSLGFKASITTKKTTHLDSYTVYISGGNTHKLFRLPRKKEKCRDFNSGRGECSRKIVSIKSVGFEPAKCITVDHPDGLYVTDDFIVTHNSWLGCSWVVMECLSKPKSNWLVAREELTKLRDTTFLTFFKVASHVGLQKDVHFRVNAQSLTVTFYNGSMVFFRELKYIPSDPEFDRIGSYDLTGAFIDEAQQIRVKAINVLRGRFSVLSGDGWKTIPKIMYSCNPAKNWIYTDFVKPDKEGTLTTDRKFVKSLATDNPFVDEAYIENLKKSDKVTVERLLDGNFEYDDDPNALIDFDAINDLFHNNHVEGGHKYITADIARLGSDKAVIMVWDGMIVIEMYEFDKSRLTEIQQTINSLKIKHGIPNSRIVADEDGVGGGVVDNLYIKGFVNNSKALNDENYFNLKAQCYYKLAEVINARQMAIRCEMSAKAKEDLIEELEYVKSYKIDSDGKMRILPKQEIISIIGRSPDYSDTLMMRIYFEVDNAIEVRSSSTAGFRKR